MIMSASHCCTIWFQSQPCREYMSIGSKDHGNSKLTCDRWSPSCLHSVICTSRTFYFSILLLLRHLHWGCGLFQISFMTFSLPGVFPSPVDLECFVGFDYAIFRGQTYVCGLLILPHGAWKLLVYHNLKWLVCFECFERVDQISCQTKQPVLLPALSRAMTSLS